MKLYIGNSSGYTIVEMVLACAIFPLIVVGMSNGYDAIRRSYTISKQLNQMYAVLSACPEIDRALEYDSLNSTTNCFPNNTFAAEGGGGGVITYSPTLTVTKTTDLPTGDPLKVIPDSKVINIDVGFQHNTSNKLRLRMLITRGGVGQQ
jgi:hypothetical protein